MASLQTSYSLPCHQSEALDRAFESLPSSPQLGSITSVSREASKVRMVSIQSKKIVFKDLMGTYNPLQ